MPTALLILPWAHDVVAEYFSSGTHHPCVSFHQAMGVWYEYTMYRGFPSAPKVFGRCIDQLPRSCVWLRGRRPKVLFARSDPLSVYHTA